MPFQRGLTKKSATGLAVGAGAAVVKGGGG